ncbi:MAG: carboxymuconolactone decarboxylase family protein [Polyangiales bacterium]
MSRPRVAPLTDDELSEEQRALLAQGRTGQMNIFRTLVRYPELYRSWMRFGSHVLGKSTLDARAREILILRIGHLCDSGYEFHQHTRIGKLAGLSDREITAIKEGPEADGWSDFDRTLLRATDELHRDACLSDSTWQALSARYGTEQLLDLIFTVGQYTLVSMALNSLGVQIERPEGEKNE